jgi:hypothetical protein
MWFAGMPSDVGGKFEDHRLSDSALKWLMDEAKSVGLVIDDQRYKKQIGVDVDRTLPDDHALGEITRMTSAGHTRWGLTLPRDPPGYEMHPSVNHRIAATAETSKPHRPPLP